MPDYPAAIDEIDKDLTLLRDASRSAPPDKQDRWQRLIDNALDERLRLMALRDTAAAARHAALTAGV